MCAEMQERTDALAPAVVADRGEGRAGGAGHWGGEGLGHARRTRHGAVGKLSRVREVEPNGLPRFSRQNYFLNFATFRQQKRRCARLRRPICEGLM